MKHVDFVDFVDLRKYIVKNKKIDDEKNNINWLRVVCFQFRKSKLNKVFFSNIITMMNISHFQSLDKQDKLIILLITI